MMWYLSILLSSQIILSWTLPAPDPFRKNDGVNLNGRKRFMVKAKNVRKKILDTAGVKLEEMVWTSLAKM